MRQVTIYDIAKEAEVSISTVSRVINDTAPVKGSTRAKIEELIQKYNFQPNAMARGLLKNETGIIGVIVPDLTNPFFPEVLAGVEHEAMQSGHTFLLSNTIGDYAKESEYLSIMREKRVDGIIFMGGRINLKHCEEHLAQELVQFANVIPTVLVNGGLRGTDLIRVAADESAGTALAVQHLIELGHTGIGFIGGEVHMTTTSIKLRAFRKAMKDGGLKVREEWMLPDSFSIDSGKRQMHHLLAMKERPTAVFCVNDYTAIGAIKAATEAGLSIPDDMSVVGFDDIPLAHHFIPELTTVSQQANELGKTAVNVLKAMMNKEKVKKLTTLEPQLIVRQSARSPRK
ncbi:LacI family DNA-binding transcriptional regulator [Paenibacillus harenae]|uniref:LacI family transcriptional regulator/LacI family purine nucleotide synthesis repressor n=1 Tax=Paenibacillus harenae TaxID=306543 RepID=A0ABT9TXW8_PAEHA|nr:LacI family DNA-binding transcriptional regulator [Paenibacillus harenae]MDQ0112213.1 LacI family transcriptional regulator/LacI family purine nucleotide synthesis repressor [Paenibacillus harenae]